jgi:CheY-like chemotaxis protein
MTFTDLIAPHLPYVRRFSRALSGSQTGGDAHVMSALEAMVAEPGLLQKDLSPRLGLYKVFLEVWNRSQMRHRPAAQSPDEPSLEHLTPKSRQAFLLTSVEGFNQDDAATIMNVDPEELIRLLDQAGREIAEQVMTDVLIIEDEPIIAMDLETLVEELGHTVTGLARTHSEAIAAIEKHRPGLVLADIQLADGSSGLDAVHEMLGKFEVPVIFVTAYPERLLTGNKVEPTFLITKPFQANTLKAVISQALFFDQRARRQSEAA